jgi:hypothetical protein
MEEKTKITSFNNIPSLAPENKKKKKNNKSNELKMTLEKKHKYFCHQFRIVGLEKNFMKSHTKIFDF